MGNIVSYFTKPAAAAVKNGEVAREDSEVPVLTSVQKIVDEAPAADNVVSKYTSGLLLLQNHFKQHFFTWQLIYHDTRLRKRDSK